MSTVLQDVRYILRGFGHSRLFIAGVVLTLALGIGANGAVFSILHAVLLQPLPYDEPDDVVMVWSAYNRPDNWQSTINAERILRWREVSPDVFTDLAGVKLEAGGIVDLALPDRAERLRSAYATPNFFDVLGVRAAHGRLFGEADDNAGHGLVVLSHALWRDAFGGDPHLIGKPVMLSIWRQGPVAFTVAGVLPPGFRFTYPAETQVWIMQSWSSLRQDAASRAITHDGAVARLEPGVSIQTAQARFDAINDQIHTPRPNTPPQFRESTRLQPVHDWVVGDTRPPLMLLGGVAGLLLLITCATVSSALFVRLTQRQRELAVRASLGADRRRLLTQLLTEGVVIALAGAAAGTLLAMLLQPALRAIVPSAVPRADEIGLTPWLLLFGIAAAGTTTILSSVAPAWRGARLDVVATLKRTSGTASADRSTARWRHGLIALQAAVAALLLVSSLLLLISFWRLGRVPLGFDGERVATVEMRLVHPKYRQPGAIAQFREDVLARVRRLPGVLDAGVTTAVPFRGVDFLYRLDRPGDGTPFNANGRGVDAAFFRIMQIPLIRGRLFTEADHASAPPVIVVSESFARTAFGDQDPLGRHINLGKPHEIIGIVGDVRYVSLDTDPYPAFYRATSQWSNELVCLVARRGPGSDDLGAAIRRVVRDVDPGQPVMNYTTVDRIVSESIADRRFFATATTTFASLALLLTLVGLTVVVARAVAERRREFAIRSALGATPARLLRDVMAGGLRPVLAGTVAGLGLAYAASTMLAQFLFNTTARDPMVFAAVGVVIVVTAALSAMMPARRAAGAAPAGALRAE